MATTTRQWHRATLRRGKRSCIAPDALAEARATLDADGLVLFVDVVISDDCQLPSIRCYQALQELDALGAVHASWPDRSTVEGGAGEFALAAMISTTATDEQIQAALLSVSDVTAVNVRAMTAAELTAGTPTAPATPDPERSSPTPITDGAAAADTTRAPGKRPAQSVRIDVERLDGLMNLVGELVIDRTRLHQIREQLTVVLKDANMSQLTENFAETTAHLTRITDELQEEIMRSRMLPVRSVLTRLPRLVRDVATKCGKKVELTTAGEETELDRSVIEEISDPLVHILRNAVDHGIERPDERSPPGKPEAGRTAVTACNQETYIYLAIKDDGKGIDTRALRQKAVEQGLVSREAAEDGNR